MGGKNPTIISKTADIDKAVAGVVRAAFGLDGQHPPDLVGVVGCLQGGVAFGGIGQPPGFANYFLRFSGGRGMRLAAAANAAGSEISASCA